MKLEFPGFVDLQVNGFAGVDFNTPGQPPDRISGAVRAMRATGVTLCLPTLITSTFERFAACARALVAAREAAVWGLHMEGPYISPLDGPRGAHPVGHVLPASVDDFARRQDAAEGRIVLVTLAPEAPGALALIEHLVGRGVRVGLGHTAATSALIEDAVRAGATLSTHLGNGCATTLDRHENPIWAQLAADGLSASFVADGIHLPPAVLKAMVRAKGAGRSLLVTDAMAAAAAPAGRFRLGELDLEREADGRVGLPGTEHLAGSALTMDRAVANTARFTGMTISDVLPLATTQPARAIGAVPRGRVTAEWNPAAQRLVILSVTEGETPERSG
jgi:N-acetylglucosamine-6-phosphate deacetylase